MKNTDSTVAADASLGSSDILPGKFGSSDHITFDVVRKDVAGVD